VVLLDDEGVAFFKSLCARRRGHELLLVRRPRGKRVDMPWSDAASAKYWMTITCERAGLRYVNFHQLRHSYASLAIMIGLDLVARALGHADTAMVQKHYWHFARRLRCPRDNAHLADVRHRGRPQGDFDPLSCDQRLQS
jgi:integrase